mmetsp:Transcript_150472/g.483647  ORF Transcript_150472/g.483647 Transcript_150472/m.483647 type:complete len:229 (-) Transcript_150472:1207-1893(-)
MRFRCESCRRLLRLQYDHLRWRLVARDCGGIRNLLGIQKAGDGGQQRAQHSCRQDTQSGVQGGDVDDLDLPGHRQGEPEDRLAALLILLVRHSPRQPDPCGATPHERQRPGRAARRSIAIGNVLARVDGDGRGDSESDLHRGGQQLETDRHALRPDRGIAPCQQELAALKIQSDAQLVEQRALPPSGHNCLLGAFPELRGAFSPHVVRSLGVETEGARSLRRPPAQRE